MNPQFPVYIVSKGRADTRMTARALDALGVPFRIIVEPYEVDAYAAVIDPAKVLALDPRFHAEYDTCDDVGDAKSQGPGAARNAAWADALARGFAWHWVMDDNIQEFYRLHRNRKILVTDGTMFRCMEDFCLRYVTVAMAGPAYDFMTKAAVALRPVIMNTRIYSCNLIRNDMPFRWRGRYNEDTDLSLRMLKAGYCTIEFNAFLQGKVSTQTVKGGCTADFYEREGTVPKSEMQVRLHPDCSRLVWKFGRPHHSVDYRRFANNKLVLRRDVQPRGGVDDYGMTLIKKPHGTTRPETETDGA
jgi:hypothetical protein